ncbi:hypothetical protein BU26DRAFT_519832 [Trematosphaeria pertusa]|uniref:Uncharacterized protein n=1 Tax=Trematosphaeria pertusa TaxID=390896 RepID=A0A6A6ICF9_9PLEO|nr:uncharacterized protein BU26DRAFT_519832 [Trematosphaeria pertusa]KAF2248071.1 hypothetical protein BU26DRAFT_519832 [Trematosphaeria pertusa]
MSDDWPISQPFEYANEEEAEWQLHDRPGQTHREDLIGWEAKDCSGVKGRLVEVVHGYKDKDKRKPRTLVVFEWRLVPGAGDNRIKNVKIIVDFRAIGLRDGVRPGNSVADYDPVPIQWAPDKTILSHFSQAPVTEAVNTEYGGQAGYNPYLALTGKRNTGSSQTVERINYRYITGGPTYVGKNSGTRNAMKWELSENAQLKSGVQYEARTAVLLRRQPLDFGKFNVTTVAEANHSLTARLLRALPIRPKDGPAAFDPTVLPGSSKGEAGDDDVAARATTRDWQNLDKLNLEDVLIKDWGVSSAEELAKKAAQVPGEGAAASEA